MTNEPDLTSVRLNKYLAQHLAIGRRQVDFLIEQGRVLLNGAVPELGARFSPGDTVVVDGKPLKTDTKTEFTYLLLDKPVGYVCSRRQQGDTPTIYSLLPTKYHHLKPVGRLDKDSSGLLLLTNDGDLAFRLTHPSFVKVKKYEVSITPALTPLHHQMINDIGIDLPDGKSKFTLERLEEGNDKTWLVTMHEGRNRQIRRTFAALGYTVTKLHRTQFGTYSLHELDGQPLKEIAVPSASPTTP